MEVNKPQLPASAILINVKQSYSSMWSKHEVLEKLKNWSPQLLHFILRGTWMSIHESPDISLKTTKVNLMAIEGKLWGSRINSAGIVNVCTKFHGNPSSRNFTLEQSGGPTDWLTNKYLHPYCYFTSLKPCVQFSANIQSQHRKCDDHIVQQLFGGCSFQRQHPGFASIHSCNLKSEVISSFP